jgi:hypothetical protein
MTPERQALIDMVPLLQRLEDGACDSYPGESCCRSCQRLGDRALEMALEALEPWPGYDRWKDPPVSSAEGPRPDVDANDVLSEPQDLNGLARVLMAMPKVDSLDHLLDAPAPDAQEVCPRCDGKGALRGEWINAGPRSLQRTCETCRGTGRAPGAEGGAP